METSRYCSTLLQSNNNYTGFHLETSRYCSALLWRNKTVEVYFWKPRDITLLCYGEIKNCRGLLLETSRYCSALLRRNKNCRGFLLETSRYCSALLWRNKTVGVSFWKPRDITLLYYGEIKLSGFPFGNLEMLLCSVTEKE